MFTYEYHFCTNFNNLLDVSYCPVGRSFYSPKLGKRQPLGEGLESWRGFYQSIRPTQMGLSLNIGKGVLTFSGTVVDYVLRSFTSENSLQQLK